MSFKRHSELMGCLESGSTAEIGMEDSFNFECDNRCMGRCCHTIKILLDPWDVEAMARHLGISGKDFIDRFCDMEEDPDSRWPYIKLYDAEKGPCAFLIEEGKCLVYPARSRNCRTYPVGRAVRFKPGGEKEEKFFMVEKQPFCFGHSAARRRTLREWFEGADSMEYYERSDLYFELINYAATVLNCRRWMNGRIAQMMMPFLYGPDILRTKMAISPEEVAHGEFYRRRIKALRVLLTELAAGFGFGPLVKDAGGEEAEDTSIMGRVREVLLAGESKKD